MWYNVRNAVFHRKTDAAHASSVAGTRPAKQTGNGCFFRIHAECRTDNPNDSVNDNVME